MSQCPREQEALTLIRAGRWPDGCDDELRAHVSVCVPCNESVQIASMLTADYRAAVRTAPVPTSGLVWWRVQRRARQEAARTVARVVTTVQAASVVIGLAVAIGIAGADNVLRTFALGPVPAWSIPLLLALSAWLALAPVAVYFAVRD